MILTQCAVCATELGLSLGKKCGRCSTRYCGPECQVQHWKEGGHDSSAKDKKAGGAGQYNASASRELLELLRRMQGCSQPVAEAEEDNSCYERTDA